MNAEREAQLAALLAALGEPWAARLRDLAADTRHFLPLLTDWNALDEVEALISRAYDVRVREAQP